MSGDRDVAIVGMGCLFPGAADVGAYWRNILAKVDAVGDPPPDWGADDYLDPGSRANDRVYTARGGYLGELATFDPLRYGVMPNSVDGGEPDQFLALRVAHDALADSGYLERPFDRERAEVVIGRGTYINRAFVNVVQHGLVLDQALALLARLHPEHGKDELHELKAELKAGLPPFTADMAPGLVPNVMSGRIANRLDLRGQNETIDAACASSLVAVDRAMQDLREDRCDLALVGGVHCSTPAPILMIFCQLEALSRTGRIRPFDREADGTLLGEGAGFVVLRRRADAERDGDRVYAVIRAVGSSSDGRALGLLAPRVEGEELALRRAYAAAGVSPRSVGLLEAHGTATPVGDAAEIDALGRVFGARDGEPPSIALGCVKSMISHLIPASGIAGLIKTALALHHKALPPTLHCENPDPELGLDTTPLYLNTETRPWIHGGPEPRRAGVDAFGFGGINAHAVLEEVAGQEATVDPLPGDAEVLVVGGASREAVKAGAGRLLALLAEREDLALADVAAALAGRMADADRQRLAIVASSTAEARERLSRALERLEDGGRTRLNDRAGAYWSEQTAGGVAFMFPGEGSQYPGMLADICLRWSEARRWFDLIDRVFWGHRSGALPSQFIFPPPGAAASPEALFTMDGAGEALFAAGQAMRAVLERLDVHPDAVVGHSSGEYSALLAAGAVELDGEDELITSTRSLNDAYRGLAEAGRIPNAALVAVAGAAPEAVDAALEAAGGALHLAVDNCPHQVILCGPQAAVAEARAALSAAGAICVGVPFDRPYHTPLFAEFSREVGRAFAGLRFVAPRIPLYSCITAERFPDDPDRIRDDVAAQWARRVRFRETIERMYADGIRVFVEVGPGGTLCSFADDTLRDRPHVSVATNVAARSGTAQLAHALAQLAAAGVPLRLDRLYERRGCEPPDLDVPPPVGRPDRAAPLSTSLPRLCVERVQSRPANGRAPVGPLTAPMTRAPEGPLPGAAPMTRAPEGVLPGAAATSRIPSVPVAPGSPIGAYTRTMERFLDVQRSVMTAVAAPRPGVRSPAPLLGRAVAVIAGESVTADVDLDLAEHRYLRDHTLGGRVSDRDPELLALPVVPLTMSMELLAEAAAELWPGRALVALREVRAHRWIAVDEGSVALRVRAVATGAGRAAVELRERSPGNGGTPIVECVACFEDARAPTAAGVDGARADDRPFRLPDAELYGDVMFHGPAFRAVRSLDRSGADGAEATLEALEADTLLASSAAPGFQIDPVLLDAAGQLIGFWAADRFERGFHVFPYRVAALTLHSAPPPPGTRVRCRARIETLGDRQLRSDIELAAGDGTVLARLEGWEDRRFDLPERLHGLRVDPGSGSLARPWRAHGLPAGLPLACTLIDDLPPGFLEDHGGIWLRVLAQLVLGRSEREAWRALPSRRRTEWVLGRAAAKDAVRELLRLCGAWVPRPGDVEIATDEQGRPRVAPGEPGPVVVSLSHAGGAAAAVAADGTRVRGVGIDLEPVRALPADLVCAAFGEQERTILTVLGPAGELHGWCAKEATAKALGAGLGVDPRRFTVGAAEARDGRVTVVAPGDVAVDVHTHRAGDHVVAVAVISQEDDQHAS